MFVSLPRHRYEVPKALITQPGAEYWRALGLTLYRPWFILTLRAAGIHEHHVTLLLASDADVVEAIEAFGAEVASLIRIDPPRDEVDDGWRATSVNEVWEAADPADGDRLLIVFATDDLDKSNGMFGEASWGLKRHRLITKVGLRQTSARQTVSSPEPTTTSNVSATSPPPCGPNCGPQRSTSPRGAVPE